MIVSSPASLRPSSEPLPIDWVLRMVAEELEEVDMEFRRNFQSQVSIISTIGEHLLLSGGKRFRPILLLLSARLCGYRGRQHISMASLVEFIHTATLLHDDVVDGAELRRGSRSVNSTWGNEASVLMGDFLFTKSFSILVESGNWKILRTISRATTVMAEGELLELTKTDDLTLTEEEYLSIIAQKTASLISSAAQIGAILGEVSEEKERALADFGMDIGMAFQLIDDNLDYTSKEEEFGKKIGIDLRDGKITLPLILALGRCHREEREIIREAVDADPLTKEHFLRVVQIINRYQGIHDTTERAMKYVESAKRRLDIFPDSPEKAGLFALADFVIQRRL